MNQEEMVKRFLRLNKMFDNLPEYNQTTFLQPFTVFVSRIQFANKLKKNFRLNENLTLDNKNLLLESSQIAIFG
jgi:hypothetical protein